jgi:hypothetical protein
MSLRLAFLTFLIPRCCHQRSQGQQPVRPVKHPFFPVVGPVVQAWIGCLYALFIQLVFVLLVFPLRT